MATEHSEILPEDRDDINAFFGLIYAAYLCMPRSALQSLPWQIQRQLVDALNAVNEHISPAYWPVGGSYEVYIRDDGTGRFVRDPLADYERGRRVVTRDDLLRLCGKDVPPADGGGESGAA